MASPDPRFDDMPAYVARWFWRFATLCEAAGGSSEETTGLIEAGCAPGPVYAREVDGTWWSALAASVGEAPPRPGQGAETWWSQGAAWHLRRARLHLRAGRTPAEAAVAVRAQFAAEFARALASVDGAREAFADFWGADGVLDGARAARHAEEEWAEWIQGAYGVCLRIFTARICVEKKSLAFVLRRTDGDTMARLDAAEGLSALITPFAPFERPACTGGRIDELLAGEHLGVERPYGFDTAGAGHS
jgi:hypothetical protein